MPPRMTSRSAGRATAAPRGGKTGGRTGRGGRRTRGRTGDQGDGRINEQGVQVGSQGNRVNDGVDGVPDFSTIIAQQLQNLLPTLLAQVGSQGSDQENGRNQNGDAVNDNIQGDVRNVIMKSVQDMSGCGDNQKVKYTARFHELARLVPHLVTLENKRIERYIYGLAPQIREMVTATKPTTIRKAVQKADTLTDEAIRNGSLKKNTEKRGNGGKPSRDRNVKDDNKMTRTGNAFATTANPVRREYTETAPKCTNYNLHHTPKSPRQACFNCNRLGHLPKECRVVPRMVNPVNARNPTVARGACFECGGIDHFKATCPRSWKQWQSGTWRSVHAGEDEARQDQKIVTGIETSNLGFSYEIEIASEQLVEINK
ncbi:reverse transcriptase domain-containing protein, partial [Tanacetum coccineum]